MNDELEFIGPMPKKMVIRVVQRNVARRAKAGEFLEKAAALYATEMDSTVVMDSEAIAPWFRAEIGFAATERFAAIFLDNGHRVLDRIVFEEGSVTRCVLYPRKVFEAAFKCNAAGVILSHNHPGGNLKPSSNDRDLTRRIQQLGESLECTLIDHIIVTREGHASFRRHGWI